MVLSRSCLPAFIRLAILAASSLIVFATEIDAVAAPASPSLPARNASLEVTVKGVGSDKGQVRLAICPAESGFPDCGARAVRTAVVEVQHGQARASFAQLPPGLYAVSVFHDANGNGRLDTFLGIPREGFGFSRNPNLRTRAPRFSEAQIQLSDASAIDINLRYIL